MLPSILTRQVKHGLKDYLQSVFSPSTENFTDIINNFAEDDDNLFRGPYLSYDLPFRDSESAGEYFPDIPLRFRPYQHQVEAFGRLTGDDPQSTIIATGTGSGKTECFTWPILDYCLKSKGDAGIKAILIYPMNALATDQARRLAKTIWDNSNLKGEVQVGLYVDAQPENPSSSMTESDVITEREEIRRNPPDILITNYKMLDYMLVRPVDKLLWDSNKVDTLRYLVVDELHTFDGAQGTDLACLIRRLKSRLECPTNHLCCVGTSATLGVEGISEIEEYAGNVFGEKFGHDSIITENRLTFDQYLDDKDAIEFEIPSSDEINNLNENLEGLTQDQLIAHTYEQWFKREPSQEVSNPNWRLSLADELDSHLFLQTLLKIIKGRPTSISEICTELATQKFLMGADREYLAGLVYSFTNLVSHARRTKPEIKDEAGNLILLPYFNVRSQLWYREMRRMVANIAEEPSLRFSDDLNDEQLRQHLPIIHCRECGSMGWASVELVRGTQFSSDLRNIYDTYFAKGERLRFILCDELTFSKPKLVKFNNNKKAMLCPNCLRYHDDVEARSSCSSCNSKKLVPVIIHQPAEIKDKALKIHHDCPYCGSKDGIVILGAQSPTLLSSSISTMFSSPFNDDPKLLTFSDSVQDAAHRAGFFEARSFKRVFQTAIKQFVNQSDGLVSLKTLIDDLSAQLQGKSDEDFVATFTPQDLQWRSDYVHLDEKGELPAEPSLPNVLHDRLAFEALAELTFRSQNGLTLEKIGILSVHPLPDVILGCAQQCQTSAFDDLGKGFEEFTERDWTWFILGLIEKMRYRGAVLTDLTEKQLAADCNWYGMLKKFKLHYKIPNLFPTQPRPTFPASRSADGYDNLTAKPGQYSEWFDKIFLRKHTLAASVYSDLFEFVFGILETAGLIVSIPSKNPRNPLRSWGLNSAELKIEEAIGALRCNKCKHVQHVPATAVNLWEGAPCTKAGCSGTKESYDNTQQREYFEQVFSKARIRRVIAREHTGLLGRERRHKIEKSFMKSVQDMWDPNILSATSTLEMGIDIGDLSTLALCAIPPEQTNYIQRIGRTGRRDGNSLNIAVATGRSHDLYFWSDPTEMIAGSVKTPGVFLNASAILKRQFAAFTLDRWIKNTKLEPMTSFNTLENCLENMKRRQRLASKKSGTASEDTSTEGRFPLDWFQYVNENVNSLLQDFFELFPEPQTIGLETQQQISDFALGEDEGFTAWVAEEFEIVVQERDKLLDKIKECRNEINRLRSIIPPPQNVEEKIDELKIERSSLRSLIKDINRKDVLGFLTQCGILPNYAFPEEGVHLKSVIYRRPEGDSSFKSDIYEYVRPATAGLGDLAPPAKFYADGKKVRIDEINVNLSGFESWRVCPDCTYMKKIVGKEVITKCPSCDSENWKDKSQKHEFIKLQQVIATTDARSAHIGDDNEEREYQNFDRSLFPYFAKDSVEEAYTLEKTPLPFGFEYVRQCDFCEINFGEPREGQEQFKAAGREAKGGGFILCRHCGKTQSKKKDENGEEKYSLNHSYRCRARDSENNGDYIPTVFLYREFKSEAIRILMPISALDSDKGVQSFIAGINLGLRLHFKGKVDHLRTTKLETKEDVITRRYLYLYDSVPGGTGYLKELMANPEQFREIFAKALQHMQTCSCNAAIEELGKIERDGCYRCVYAYRDSARMEKTSRSHAIDMFSTILEFWDSLEPIKSISSIKENAIFESELEAMFIHRLEQMKEEGSGSFRKISVNGKSGYYLKVNKESPAWLIEPQVPMFDQEDGHEFSRADFVIRPRNQSSDLKPIAVYTDGWSYHQDKIGSDFEKRLKISRSGEYWTWSITYDDLVNEQDGIVDHLWNLFANVNQSFHELPEELKAFPDVLRLAKEPTTKILESYLQGETQPAWHEIPGFLSFATIMSPDKVTDWGQIQSHFESFNGDDITDFIAEHGDTSKTAMIRSNSISMVATFEAMDDLTTSIPIILFDDQSVPADAPPDLIATKKKAWNTSLYYLNLIQFATKSHVAVSSNIENPLPSAVVQIAESDKEWDAMINLAQKEIIPVLVTLKEAQVPIPTIGYELLVGTRVAAEAELAWETQKIAVTNQNHVGKFEKEKWRVYVVEDIIENPKLIIDLFDK